jgi:hypothetical protein
MDCHHLMQYAILSMPDVDPEDVRLGQLLTLLGGMTVVLLGWLLCFLFL